MHSGYDDSWGVRLVGQQDAPRVKPWVIGQSVPYVLLQNQTLGGNFQIG